MTNAEHGGGPLALGFELAHPLVASTSFRSSQTLLDYDVVFWDPAWVLNEYNVAFDSPYQGRRLLDQSDSALVRGDLSRRRREMVDLLKIGGVIVVFLCEPEQFFIYTGEKEHSGTGRNRQTTEIVTSVSLLTAFSLSLSLVGAAGRQMESRRAEPFATFWRAYGREFEYRAYVEDAPGLEQVVIRRSDRVVAATVRAEKGLVLLLPDLVVDDDEATQQNREVAVTQGILDLIRALREGSGRFVLPSWAGRYKLPLEDFVSEAVRKSEKSVERALARQAKARADLTELSQRKLLFAGSGAELESQVHRALEGIGFDVEGSERGRADLIARSDAAVLVIEVKGLTKSATEANAAQLEKWASAYYEEHGTQPKSVLVVNAYSQTELDKRTAADFPHQMLAYAEARGHCLITGLQLLGAWIAVERDPRRAEQVRRSIVECVGVYQGFESASEAGLTFAADTVVAERTSDRS